MPPGPPNSLLKSPPCRVGRGERHHQGARRSYCVFSGTEHHIFILLSNPTPTQRPLRLKNCASISCCSKTVLLFLCAYSSMPQAWHFEPQQCARSNSHGAFNTPAGVRLGALDRIRVGRRTAYRGMAWRIGQRCHGQRRS